MKKLAIVLLFAAQAAHADIASLTPKFTITAHPTVDKDGVPLPATGPKALRDTRIYCDAPASALATLMPKYVITPPSLTVQAAAGDFSLGLHTCFAAGLNQAGEDGLVSNVVSFTLSPIVTIPGAPGALSVQ